MPVQDIFSSLESRTESMSSQETAGYSSHHDPLTTFFITIKEFGVIVTLFTSGSDKTSCASGDTCACLKSLISYT